MPLIELLKRVLQAVRKAFEKALFKALFKDEQQFFVADYDISPGLNLPPPSAFDKFDDFVQYLDETKGGQRNLLTFWKSENAYNDVATRFKTECGLTTDAARRTTTHGPSEPRWRLDWAKVLLAFWGLAATLFGFLVPWFLGMWVAPAIHVAKSDVPTNVLVHSQFDVEFQVFNQHASAPCDIEFDSPVYELVSGGDPAPTRTLSAPDLIKNFLPGEKHVSVSGVIDGPGTYHVRLTAHAKAGALRGKRTEEAYRVVRVWPAYQVSKVRRTRPFNPKTSAAPIAGEQCNVHCTLETGDDYPDGIKLVAFLTLVPDVKFITVVFPEVAEIPEARCKENHGAEMTMQEWKTPPLKKFQDYGFELVLSSKAGSRPDWLDIAKKIRFR